MDQKMIKRMFLFALFCGVMLAALCSCEKKGDQPKSGKLVIAVVPKGTMHEFWKSIHAGAMKAAEESGAEIAWKGPLKEDDRESQISVVEDMTNRNVAGIVLAPLDNTALKMPVANAVRSGIPVVIIDSGIDSNDYTSFVATDNYVAGEKAGKHLAELLGSKGKIAVLRYAEGSASTMAREQGFLDAIKGFKEIEVVSSNQYGGATTESSYKASENLLAPYKKADGMLSIDGIFTPNESTTFGMLRALQDGGLAGKVKFVGFDSSAKLVQALAAGQINALILQNPLNMGYLGVKAMVAHLRGQPVEKRIDTGSTVVTKENMNSPEMKELLFPDFKKWLKE
jgi:ribose transport system substrate-binding protein